MVFPCSGGKSVPRRSALFTTADDTRLTEKISSSVRRNSLFLFLSLFLLLLRDSQSDRQRFSCVSLPSMNVTMWVCARGASNTREVKLGNCSRAGCWRAASARRRCKVCVCVCVSVCVCTLATDWGPTRMSECTVWKSASCLWRETATLTCASLF